MMKTVKTTGLAICMALLLTAIAGAGSASAAQFRAEEYPTSVTGTQTVAPKFTTWEKGPTWTCSSMTTTGTITVASTTLSLTPTFSGCSFFGSAAAVKVNSCKFVFNNSSEQWVNSATMDVSCSKEGDQIEVVTGVCTMKIPPQTALSSAEFSGGPQQEGPGGESYQRKINLALNTAGIKYSLAGAVCFKPGEHEDGGLTGSSVIKGLNAQHEVGVYLSNEQSANFPMFAAEQYPLVVNAELSGSLSINLPKAAEGVSCSTFKGRTAISGVPRGNLIMPLRAWEFCPGATKLKRNGCAFTFSGPITGITSGSLAVECPTGKEMTFDYAWAGCHISIPSQGGLSGISYTESGSGATRIVTANVAVTKLKFSSTGAACGETGTRENGQLTFTWPLKGYEWAGEEQLTDEGIQYYEPKDTGVQKGLWID
jgi:hypothetical protein